MVVHNFSRNHYYVMIFVGQGDIHIFVRQGDIFLSYKGTFSVASLWPQQATGARYQFKNFSKTWRQAVLAYMQSFIQIGSVGSENKRDIVRTDLLIYYMIMEITGIYFHSFLAKISWKQRFWQKNPSRDGLTKYFLHENNFFIFSHCV